MTAASWPDAILMRLPRPVRGRYMARLVRKSFGVPRPLVLLALAVTALLPVFMVLLVAGAIIDALLPWGCRFAPGGFLLDYGVAVLALGLIGAGVVAGAAYRRICPDLLNGEFTEQGETARLRHCPDCGYDLRGDGGAQCPECGCTIVFSRADVEPREGLADSRLCAAPARLMRVVILPGAAAGLVALVSFGIVHAALITPIWQRLPGGWPFAVLGGSAIAWAFDALRRGGALRTGLGDALRFGVLLWLGLVPMNALGLLLRVLALRDGAGAWEVAAEVGLALASGAVTGWLLTRRLRAAVSMGAATLALGLATGGPIPLTTIAGAAIFAWMLLICQLAAGAVAAVRRFTIGSATVR